MPYIFTAKHLGKSEQMKDKMSGECGIHGGEDKCMQGLFCGGLGRHTQKWE
jgi:hypothetical protein